MTRRSREIAVIPRAQTTARCWTSARFVSVAGMTCAVFTPTRGVGVAALPGLGGQVAFEDNETENIFVFPNNHEVGGAALHLLAVLSQPSIPIVCSSVRAVHVIALWYFSTHSSDILVLATRDTPPDGLL